MNTNATHNFVLVHGACHGGWCWEHVATNLQALGSSVSTPTQIGLAERADELTRSITLTDFVDDLVEHLEKIDLNDIVLVGHSFAGAAITGAADRVPSRIAKLIYLDAMVLENGETPFDRLDDSIVNERTELAQSSSGGLSLPAPPPSAFGVFDPNDAEWVKERLTPHPFGAFVTPLAISGPVGNGLDITYVVCTDPVYEPLAASRERAINLDWTIKEIATGHDAMITAPALTTELLLNIADS